MLIEVEYSSINYKDTLSAAGNKGLSVKESMCFGTAGLTAALSVKHLISNGVLPQIGKVAVSGATGGVGSIAVSILSKLGYQVTAISGKDEHNFLIDILGATEIIKKTLFYPLH